jgi:hypothetical protein
MADVHEGETLYLTNDGAVVTGNDPNAAYLLVAKGAEYGPAVAELYERVTGKRDHRKAIDAALASSEAEQPDPEPEPGSEPKQRATGGPENKQRQPATTKS